MSALPEILALLCFRVGLSVSNLEMGITRIRGPPTTTAAFGGEHLERAQISGLAPYLPQGPAKKFPHCWLKISRSPKYPHYEWVDQRWLGYTKNRVLGRSTISILSLNLKPRRRSRRYYVRCLFTTFYPYVRGHENV